MDPIRSERDLDDLRRYATAWSVVLAWAKHGLFDAMAHGEPMMPADIAAHDDALRNTAPILAHLGLLIHHPQPDGSSAWALSRSARDLIASGAMPGAKAWDGFDDLTRIHTVLEQGGPIRDRDGRSKVTSGGVVVADPEKTRTFMDMLYRRSEESSAETARLLLPWVPSGRALDLGGGHGRYGYELVKNGLSVTLFDRDICCQIARERFDGQIQTLSGDFMVDDLGGPYHLIVLSNIVHGLGPDEIETLFPRLRSALIPGGVLAIKDMFLDDSMSQSQAATFFGLTMLMYTSAGRSHTISDMRSSLQRAGFDELDTVEVRDQNFSVLIAR